MIRDITYSDEFVRFGNYVIKVSDDPAQLDPDFIHEVCGERLCTIEHDDSLRVLIDVADGHVCSNSDELLLPATATCRYCLRAISPVVVWESRVIDWEDNGDSGCIRNPISNEDGVGGHLPA